MDHPTVVSLLYKLSKYSFGEMIELLVISMIVGEEGKILAIEQVITFLRTLQETFILEFYRKMILVSLNTKEIFENE